MGICQFCLIFHTEVNSVLYSLVIFFAVSVWYVDLRMKEFPTLQTPEELLHQSCIRMRRANYSHWDSNLTLAPADKLTVPKIK